MSWKHSTCDNRDVPSKLALRRHFLTAYHSDEPPSVFDACQGQGLLWDALRKEFAIGKYWGVDIKPRRGGIKVDSVRILQMPGWDFDVIDIDTHGHPWAHWAVLLPNVRKPTTVFLTIGHVVRGSEGMGGNKVVNKALGLGKLRVPPILRWSVNAIARPYVLGMAFDYGLEIVEAGEMATGERTYLKRHNADYLGLHLRPRRNTPKEDTE